MRILSAAALAVILSGSIHAYPQSPLPLSGCATPAEVRATFETTLAQESLVKLKIKDRVVLQQKVLDELLAKYPHEYLLYEQQINQAQILQMYATDQAATDAAKQKFEALRDRWVKGAKDHPDDPLALLLAGRALEGKDTPEALRMLDAAKAEAPEFPWPAHELALQYWSGKFADDAKMKENLEAFYSLCPAWTADSSYGGMRDRMMLQKDLPAMGKTTTPLRARLETETDPVRLKDYQILWQREFLVRPPSEHDALRQQIRLDLKRLEALAPSGDAGYRSFLVEGYGLSGASKDELAAMADAAARDFPHGAPAETKLWDEWNKQHPRPDGQKDLDAWKAYEAADLDQVKQLIREFPDDVYAQRSELLQVALDDEFISQEDGIAALDRYLQAMQDYSGFGTMSFQDVDPPRFLLDHGWQPERALELLKKTSTYRDGGHTKVDWWDNIADSDLRRFQRGDDSQDRDTLGMILKAAALAGKPDEALKFRAAIEGPLPSDKNARETYWTNRARLAALDKRQQDAVVYYRLALDSRTHQPEYRHGLLRDELTAEFHDLWKVQGGTETAWLAWNPPASAAASAVSTDKDKAAIAKSAAAAKKPDADGDWRDAGKDMPAFELSDFAGKTWRLGDLSGKVVVITTWATWCEWCRLEDQYLEKFYEKEKDRKDVAILSFDVDENPGQVLPFMQKQGYTFPVLAAFSIPQKMQDLVPRTWIVGANGHWLWMKNGFDDAQTYADFEKEMLDRIEKAKAGQ